MSRQCSICGENPCDCYEETTYDAILAEMRCREDSTRASYVQSYGDIHDDLPDQSDIEKILEDTRILRYYIYSSDSIHILEIDEIEDTACWQLTRLPR